MDSSDLTSFAGDRALIPLARTGAARVTHAPQVQCMNGEHCSDEWEKSQWSCGAGGAESAMPPDAAAEL
jgi:hypothetical protein